MFDIGFNVSIKDWPEVVSSNQLSRFFDSIIASQRIIVVLIDYLRINNLSDVKEALMIEYIFCIFLALW